MGITTPCLFTHHVTSALTRSPHLEGSASSHRPRGATRGQEGDARVGSPHTHTSHRPRSWPGLPACPPLRPGPSHRQPTGVAFLPPTRPPDRTRLEPCRPRRIRLPRRRASRPGRAVAPRPRSARPQCDCKHAAHQYGYKLCGHLGHVFRGQLTSTVWGSNPQCMHWTQLAHQYGLGLQSQSNAPVPHSWYLAPCPSQNCLPTYLMREANRGDQRRSEAVGGRISCTHPPIHRTWARSEAEAESGARTLPIHRTWVRPRHRKRRALGRSGRRSEEHP